MVFKVLFLYNILKYFKYNKVYILQFMLYVVWVIFAGSNHDDVLTICKTWTCSYLHG